MANDHEQSRGAAWLHNTGNQAPVVQGVDNSIDFDGPYLVSSDFSAG